MSDLIQYAPIIIVILFTFLQYKFFATPKDLEVKHREIMAEVEERFTTKESINSFKENSNNEINNLKKDLEDINDKLDMICQKILGNM